MLKVHNQASFTREIEKLVRIDKMNYLEAISHYMHTTGIEPESIPKLLTQCLKDKLEDEATQLKLINRKKSKLPLIEE
jgi:hypothetical protein